MKTLMIDIGILIGCSIIAASTLNACSTPAIASTITIKTNHLIVLNNATSYGGNAYPVRLSKITSVTPQRHCGFFAPAIRPASQAGCVNGASVISNTKRLYSVYGGMTSQNKAAMPNMRGGSSKPRVNPVTLTSQVMATSQNSKLLGGSHA